MVNTKQHPRSQQRGNPILSYEVEVESWRFTAYIFFWGFCAFARFVSVRYVVAYLEAGPETPGDTCGPFGDRGSNSRLQKEGIVTPGEGFDFYTETHLEDFFGFSNICTNWDYTPARESTAMVYPLFEYSLLIYLVLDFLNTKIAYLKGEINEWFWGFSKVCIVFNLFFCAMFRMIFVCIAYEQVKQHTMGFLGLQIALILVAIQNTLFMIDTNVAYKYLGGTVTSTRFWALFYLVVLIIISGFKVTATIYVVQNGVGAPWTLKPSGINGWYVGRLVDIIWMIVNAILPLFISRLRANEDSPLIIEVRTKDEPTYIDGSSEESAALTSGGGEARYESVVQEAAI